LHYIAGERKIFFNSLYYNLYKGSSIKVANIDLYILLVYNYIQEIKLYKMKTLQKRKKYKTVFRATYNLYETTRTKLHISFIERQRSYKSFAVIDSKFSLVYFLRINTVAPLSRIPLSDRFYRYHCQSPAVAPCY